MGTVMNEWLIKTANPSAYYPPDSETSSEFTNVIVAGQIDGDTVLNIMHTEGPTKAGDVLIGGWDFDGTAVATVDADLYQQLRPLGNAPPRDDGQGGQTRGGEATGHLVMHGYLGWGLNRQQSLRQLNTEAQSAPQAGDYSQGTLEAAYPADNQPFGIEVRHKYFEGNDNPAWDGYGWRAEILGGASSRDPSARAIGIYRDPECTDYWYTTGAFSEQLSEWQVDEGGNPLTVWATEYNPAFLTGTGEPSPTVQHHSVLLGSAQEGYATLNPQDTLVRHLFWEQTQGGSGGEWVDTGVTVTRYVAANTYEVTDSSIFAADDQLRIGGQETSFLREQGAGIIVVNPDVGDQTGQSIERKQ